MTRITIVAALLALAACGSPPPEKAAKNPPEAPAALPEPGPASATSDQAAATMVETYFSLLEQGDFAAANRLWGNAATGADAFKAKFGDFEEIHAEVDKPGPSEGACGSIYIEVPVRVRSRMVGDVTRLKIGKVVLRRVNNVDGATPAQLRWHIQSVELTPA